VRAEYPKRGTRNVEWHTCPPGVIPKVGSTADGFEVERVEAAPQHDYTAGLGEQRRGIHCLAAPSLATRIQAHHPLFANKWQSQSSWPVGGRAGPSGFRRFRFSAKLRRSMPHDIHQAIAEDAAILQQDKQLNADAMYAIHEGDGIQGEVERAVDFAKHEFEARFLAAPERMALLERAQLAKGRHLSHVVHFGDQQLFAGATNYVCLLFPTKAGADACRWVRADNLPGGLNTFRAHEATWPASRLTPADWNFALDAGTTALEREIDARVYRLYGLTDDEIKLVEEMNR